MLSVIGNVSKCFPSVKGLDSQEFLSSKFVFKTLGGETHFSWSGLNILKE